MSGKLVKIPDEEFEILTKMKEKESWTYKTTLSKAIRFFAKAKRILK